MDFLLDRMLFQFSQNLINNLCTFDELIGLFFNYIKS